MIDSRLTKRIGAAVLAGGLALGVPVALRGTASANHTGTNGAVTRGPDLVFLDCVTTNQTTTPAAGDPSPAPTASGGKNPQAAATGSGCTTQAQTSSTVDLKVRFTVDGVGVGGRTISFTKSGETASGAPAAGPTATARFPAGQPSGTASATDNMSAACFTDANGECTVRITKTNQGRVTVTGTETQSTETANQTVDFRDGSSAMASISEIDRITVKPAEDDYKGTDCQAVTDGQSEGSGATAGTQSSTAEGNGCPSSSFFVVSGTPGRPVQVTYQLRDAGGTDPEQGRPLTNREVVLSLPVTTPYFFTPNCGPVTFTDGTTPNRTVAGNPAPNYRQCRFVGATPGGRVGRFFSLGQSLRLKSDANGLVTVTIAVERVGEFDADGQDSVLVCGAPAPADPNAATPNSCTSGGLKGSVQGEGEPQAAPPAPTQFTFPNEDAPIWFNTRNRPLNGVGIDMRQVDSQSPFGLTSTSFGSATSEDSPGTAVPGPSGTNAFSRSFSALTASGQVIASPTEKKFVVLLTDQFGNLVKVPETDVSLSVSGPGVIRRDCVIAGGPLGPTTCTNPAGPNTNFDAQAKPTTTPASTAANNPSRRSTSHDRTTGSYILPANQDRFSLTGNPETTVTLTAVWQAPATRFTSVAPTSTPTATPSATTSTPTPSATTSTPTPSPTTSSPTPSPTTSSPTPSPTTASPTPTQPQRMAARVVLSSSHSRITAGNAPTLTGQVFDTNGAPLGGVNVTLFEKSFGEFSYSQTPGGQATSGPDGRFTITIRPINQTSYGANTDDGRANSNLVQIRVNARMDINSPAPNSLVTNPVTLSGRLLPAYNARPIGLAYINAAGRYVYLGQRNSVNGTWSVRAGARVPAGTYTFVVYMSPTQGTDKGARSVRLTVR